MTRKCLKNGAPGEIRTPDRSVRSRVLYPAELRAHCFSSRVNALVGARPAPTNSYGGERVRLHSIQGFPVLSMKAFI